jgi:hypothetical protein
MTHDLISPPQQYLMKSKNNEAPCYVFFSSCHLLSVWSKRYPQHFILIQSAEKLNNDDKSYVNNILEIYLTVSNGPSEWILPTVSPEDGNKPTSRYTVFFSEY